MDKSGIAPAPVLFLARCGKREELLVWLCPFLHPPLCAFWNAISGQILSRTSVLESVERVMEGHSVVISPDGQRLLSPNVVDIELSCLVGLV